ncbi:hypothetical protein SEA_KARDASHIAN_38 [Streptomyces phage Kardashian]|nr:hypothetical protein SEA_KARDASHIAN_38 [Streptomyces phage Kardashian]
MQLATTVEELLNDPWFVLFAPAGVLVILLILYFIGKGNIDL